MLGVFVVSGSDFLPYVGVPDTETPYALIMD
jgi:hypothetical protein